MEYDQQRAFLWFVITKILFLPFFVFFFLFFPPPLDDHEWSKPPRRRRPHYLLRPCHVPCHITFFFELEKMTRNRRRTVQIMTINVLERGYVSEPKFFSNSSGWPVWLPNHPPQAWQVLVRSESSFPRVPPGQRLLPTPDCWHLPLAILTRPPVPLESMWP